MLMAQGKRIQMGNTHINNWEKKGMDGKATY